MGSEAALPGQWRPLHPASVAVNLVPRGVRALRSAWPLLIPIVMGGGDITSAVDLVLLVAFFGLTVGNTVWHWLTLRYRAVDGRLEIRQIGLTRTVRVIDPARVQNVELVRNVFHQLSGLVEVRIETASGDEVEGQLSALSVDDAEALRSFLERRPARADPEATPEAAIPPRLRNDPLDLFRYGATTARFGAVAVVIGLVVEYTGVMAPERLAALELGPLAGYAGVAVILAALSGAWLFGIGAAIVRHWGFTLTLTPDRIGVRSGLFTQRRLELPRRKVQVVVATEPLVRRWVGFGSVTVETAAARSGSGGTERLAAMAPVVDREELPVLVDELLPQLDVDPWGDTLHPPHPRALPRALFRSTVQPVLATAAAVAFFGPWGAVVVGWLPLALVGAVLDHRHQGWAITPGAVVSRSGFFVRRHVVVERAKIQSAEWVQGLVLRRLGLAQLQVRVAGTAISLPLVAEEVARRWVDELTRRVAEPPPEPSPEPEPESVEVAEGLLDEGQPVVAEEHLAVDEEGGGAEDPPVDGGVGERP